MDHSEGQKSQLPNTSLDDSPFLSVRTTRLRKKKTQSKLTFLKEVAKKNDTQKTSENENSCEGDTKSEENPLEILPAESQCSGDVTSVNISGNKEENISGNKEENISGNKEENINGNKEENTVRACPVCWKHFGNAGDQMQHMKTCAAKHNLTLKQLLDAVDLQTKQIEERKTLGLPCVPVSSSVRKSTSKKSSVGDKNDPDLQLGLALSVSMRESEEQNDLREQEIMLEAGLGDEVAANQASLLERFGFTSTRPVLPSIYPRARPGKTKLKGTPLLLVRTSDERERLITEKVAIILTNEENQHPTSHEQENELSVKRHNLQSETLAQIQNIKCCLWQKASASPSPNDCDIYYVKCLSWVISPSTIKLGSKLKHLSQVPCRLKTPEKCLQSVVEDVNLNRMEQNNEIFHDSSQDILNRQKNEDESSSSICNGNDNDEEIIIPEPTNMETQGKSNEFMSKFIGDWSNLLNNCHRSDIRIYVLDGEEIFVHELVLFARCPVVLKDVKRANNSLKYIVWSEISFECALAFLYFIYCGSTCKIDELKNCVDEVYFLSLKYCVEDLCCYLKPAINERKFFEKYAYEDWNSITSDVHSMVVKPYYESHSALTSDFGLVPAYKSQTQILLMSEQNVAKREEKHIENNWERSEQGIFVRSPERNDYLLESCVSPDPFVDSCDQEVTNVSCTWKTSSLNTQQNIDNLLEALNVDEDEKFHQIPLEYKNKTKSEQSGTCEFIKESPDVEIVDEEMDDIHQASTIKKRKLSNCNSLGLKQICTNERNSVRKSLLPSFSDEGENTLPNEKDEAKINWSQNIYKTDSVSSVESVDNVSINSSISQRTEEMDDNSGEVLEVVHSTNVECPIKDKLTLKSIPSVSNEKLSGIQAIVADTSTDMLGDFCADYEYQNFCANYSPCSEKFSHSKHDSEKSSKNAVSVKQTFFETHDTQDKGKSPISSPLSVKSLTRGETPIMFHKNRSSREQFTLTRTRSSSNLSVNDNCSLSSPISIKCLSQNSIHLKSSNDICTEKNNIQFASDAERDVFNPGTSSGMITQSPVTPSSHVQRTPNRSLNSVKRLLEDSFTAELERNLLERKFDCESWPCSTPNSTQSKKPVFSKHLQNIRTGDNCITPMADYSGMDSPMLKRELQKYGLKPLKRKRAKQMLQHIYNELHPLVPVQSDDGRSEFVRSTQDDVLPLSSPHKQSHEISTQKDHKKESKLQSNDRSEFVRSTQDDVLPLSCADKRSDDISTQKDCKKKSKIQSNDDRSEFVRSTGDNILPLSRSGKLSDEISTQKDRKKRSKMQSNDDRSEFVRSTEDVLSLSRTGIWSDEISTQKDRKKKSKMRKGDDAIHSTAEAEIPSDNEVSFPSSQESSSSSQCQFEVPEDPAEDGAQTQGDDSELPFIVHKYITSNPELHQQVLLYEPIRLEQLHEGLKAQNYKFKLSQLMEYLDEECITFRTNQGTKSKKRQKKSSK